MNTIYKLYQADPHFIHVVLFVIAVILVCGAVEIIKDIYEN